MKRLLHSFNHGVGFKWGNRKCGSPYAPFSGYLGTGPIYVQEAWRQYYGILEKWPRGGGFSDKYWQIWNEIIALRKAEKEPIPPEPKKS